MADVGFGTGSLHKQKIPLDEILDFYKEVGATAVEISLGSIDELNNFTLINLEEKIKNFNFVSIHAPFRNIRYNSDTTREVLTTLNYKARNHKINGIVIHPDLVEDFSNLTNSDLPILIENMNLEKQSGKFAWEFETYRLFDLGYVLDIEHSYGNNSNIEFANELINAMGSRLNHLHVSGKKNNQNHVLCCESENKPFIEKILKNCKAPRISEGILPSLDYDLAKREIEYLKGF